MESVRLASRRWRGTCSRSPTTPEQRVESLSGVRAPTKPVPGPTSGYHGKSMSFEVATPIFEGPLDLLLQLITARRLDVTQLSLGDLVSEYLSHLDLMRTLDLEVTSEFLVIASTLIQLKARRLLPGDSDVDLDEDLLLASERDRLLSRLLANLTFKDVAAVLAHRLAPTHPFVPTEARARPPANLTFKAVAAVLAHRLETTDLFVPREAGADPGTKPPPAELRIGVDAPGLAAMALRILSRAEDEPGLDHLDLDLPSVSEAIADLRRRLDADIETDFERLTRHPDRPIEVVAYFLAVLELARWGLVEARQADHTAPITLRRTSSAVGAVVSEWD